MCFFTCVCHWVDIPVPQLQVPSCVSSRGRAESGDEWQGAVRSQPVESSKEVRMRNQQDEEREEECSTSGCNEWESEQTDNPKLLAHNWYTYGSLLRQTHICTKSYHVHKMRQLLRAHTQIIASLLPLQIKIWHYYFWKRCLGKWLKN